MKVGASRGKVITLGALVLVGGYFFYTNVISDSGEAPPSASKPSGGALSTRTNAIKNIFDTAPAAAPKGSVVRTATRSKASEEFHPSMQRKPEDAIDPAQIDPTLKLDRLAKVQAVTLEGISRNPFQFGAPPAPPAPKVTVDPKAIKAAMAKSAQPAAPPQPVKPPPPTLNLPWKYFGYSSPGGSPRKKAFFLDGEDILTAAEGDVVKKKYRVVRIGVNSVVVEDTDTKLQQTLPLQEEAAA